MNQIEIAKYRLYSQQLIESKFTSAVELVNWFGAVQGQEYAQTKWGLGLRLQNLVDADIENKLEQGKILRTHLLRPTWHFVAAKDINWLLMLTAPRVQAVNGTMYRKLELDTIILNRSLEIIYGLLKGDKNLTREEIKKALSAKGINAIGLRLVYIMMNAELEGIVCSGKRRGKQNTYALLDERVANPIILTKEEALLELTIRFFNSKGPATIQDFASWSGLTIADCKKGIDEVGRMFDSFVTDDMLYYYSSGYSFSNYQPELYLLPEYDELIMGYKNRKALMQEFNKMTMKYFSTILYDSQIIGTYKRTIKEKSADFKFDFFNALNKSQKKKLEKQLERFEQFTHMNKIFNLFFKTLE